MAVAARVDGAPIRARCGLTVGTTVILDRDLECDGTGLTLRNPRTVVQLNGHTLRFKPRCEDSDAVGIVVEGTADGAQILGPGAIRGFPTGIHADGPSRLQVRDVTVVDACDRGIGIARADKLEARNLLLRKNGTVASDRGSAVDIEDSNGVTLADSLIVLNGAGSRSAAIDMHGCDECRIAGNRVVANNGAGIRLDAESNGTEVERNVVMDNQVSDIVDQGADNALALNAFERGDGARPPVLWPLVGPSAAPIIGVAGCGVVHDVVPPRQTVTVTCPQDPGLRGLRNSVVGYRLLNPLAPALPFAASCKPGEVVAATSGGGGAIRCTNTDSVWNVILEVTCCLN